MTTERTVIAKGPPPLEQWPEWMRIANAEYELGVREVAGDDDNPRIVEYLRCTRLDEQALVDETAWCAAFACWCLEHSGHRNPRYAMAKNFLKYGEFINPEDARFGDILIFRRDKTSSHAHVCFLVLDVGNEYEVLGGNQRNRVCFSTEHKGNLLGVRRPVKP
jgi:uncharacterized protein (TIGR02594 family)